MFTGLHKGTKHWCLSARLHGITYKAAVMSIFATVRTLARLLMCAVMYQCAVRCSLLYTHCGGDVGRGLSAEEKHQTVAEME
jgi:hypothetical protein